MENNLVQVLIFVGIAAYGLWSVVKSAKEKQRKDMPHQHGENFPFPTPTTSHKSREREEDIEDWEMVEEGTSGLHALQDVHIYSKEGGESLEVETHSPIDEVQENQVKPEIDLRTAVIYSELLEGQKWKQY